MSCPSWQWQRTGHRWSPVRSLPVAPFKLWCDLGRCSRTVVVMKLRRISAFNKERHNFNSKKKKKNRQSCLTLRVAAEMSGRPVAADHSTKSVAAAGGDPSAAAAAGGDPSAAAATRSDPPAAVAACCDPPGLLQPAVIPPAAATAGGDPPALEYRNSQYIEFDTR